MRNINLAKWLGFFVVVLFLFSTTMPAQNLIKKEADDYQINHTITFSTSDFSFDNFMGYDTVNLNEGTIINEIGKPMMPAKQINIALPEGMIAEDVKITDIDFQKIKGNYNISPAQPPQKIGTSIDEVEFATPDHLTYNSKRAYPQKTVELIDQSDLCGQSWATIQVNPLKYYPKQNELVMVKSITFAVTGDSGYVCGDYLPISMSESNQETYQRMIENVVVNPKDIKLHSSENYPQIIGVGPGDYDYVIITQDSWVDDFQPLADWKTAKGIPTNIVSTNWIYYSGGYSGSNQDKIRAFVQDARNTWGSMYFLLGGDTNIIPYYTDSFYLSGEGQTLDLPSDTYYADYDRDWTCEVHLGRAPTRYTSQIPTFINKIFLYEKNPPLSNYAKTAFFCGFDLHSYNSGEGEDCKIDIRNYYLPSGWTYRSEYDSEGGTHKSDVLNYLDLGNNLVNHADHSGSTSLGVGYTNHGDSMENGDITGISNGDRLSIFYSMGCHSCDYTVTTGIAEATVRDSTGGSVAFVGNSDYGWYVPYEDDYASMRYDRYFFRSLFNQNHFKLGESFSDHKNDAYWSGGMGQDNYDKFIFVELTLLGDPELPIWTDNPSSMSVTHPSTVNIGSSSFAVNTNAPYATICLWKGDEIYEIATANSAGDYTFIINPLTTGVLDVTVTKHNYLPYEGTATVSQINHPPYVPTPAYPLDGATDISIDGVLAWIGGDQDSGDTVEYDVYFGTSPSPPYFDTTPIYQYWQTSINYDLPTLQYDTTYYWKIVARDNHGEESTSSIWDFTTEDEPTYILTTIAEGAGEIFKDPDLPSYPYGQVVELTAYPVPGYWHFVQWEGDVDDIYDNPTTITMYEDETVTAYFEPDELTLDIDIIGEGTVLKDPDQATYHFNDVVELTPIPENGWSFIEWSGDVLPGHENDNPLYLTIEGNMQVTATFNPDPFVLNLIDFPMYQAQQPNPEQMTGPAVAQMTLNYLWWNDNQDPTPPMLYDDQQWLYDVGRTNNSNPGLTSLDMDGMWSLLQTYRPLPYNEYGYNFLKRHNTDQLEMLKQICQWVNYTIGTYGGYTEGHPEHVPGIIPAYGNYENWMAIRGIHTDRFVYPMPEELEVYGFWINDPMPDGIGEYSYVTAPEFTSTYYQQLDVSGDPYDGEYVAIVEPPEDVEQSNIILKTPNVQFNSYQKNILKQIRESEIIPRELKLLSDKWIVDAAILGLQEELMDNDEAFAELFETTVADTPIFIDSSNGYYAIPFNLLQRHTQGEEQLTAIVVLIDADDGNFRGVSWTEEPMNYLPVKKESAINIANSYFEEQGIEPLIIKDVKLIHKDNSPYYPDWMITFEGYQMYIGQDESIEMINVK